MIHKNRNEEGLPPEAEGSLAALKKAEQEILDLKEKIAQKPTDRYQAILNSMDDGFVFCQLVRDEQGQAIDYRYLDFNTAFEKQRGRPIEHFAGRTVSQVHPDAHSQWIEMYANVVDTNEPLRKEVLHNDNWYEITAYPFKDDCFSVIFRNVNERKKTEHQLAAAESKYKSQLEKDVGERTRELSASRQQYVSLVENTPDVITRWDKDLKLIFANSAFAEKTGLELDALYGKTNLEMGFPTEIATSYMHSLQRVFETGQPFEHFHAFPTPHGEVYYFSRIVPEKNEKGEVKTVLRIARDITHIKKAEDEILGLKDEIAQKATDKYLTLFNTMEEGFLVIELIRDQTGKCVNYTFLEVNPAFEKLIGLKPADVVGKTVLDIFPTLDHWWLDTYGEIGDKQEATRFEQYLKESDRWYESLVYPMWDGQIAVIYNDISDRKRQEQSQALLSAISKELVELTAIDETIQRLGAKIGEHFGVSWCVFAEIDHENPITIYGWNRGEVTPLKGTYRLRDFYSEEQFASKNAGVESVVRDIFVEDHPHAELTKSYGIRSFIGIPLVRDQKWCFTLSIMHTEPRQWREDEIELLREIADRIWTRLERARAEETLRRSEERLHHLVAERTEELQRSNEDLRQFAHVASHDLKEPVRKMKIFQDRIIYEFSDVLPEKVKTYLNKIGNAADRMFSMIEGVLKYSKLGDGEQTEELVNLNETISDISTDLELLIQQKNATINTQNLPVLTGSKVLLYQLFYNLILNSLKFAKTGVPSRIEINCETIMQNEQIFYKIILSDNGIGFEAANAEKIFITFTKLNPANEYEGTGLGLALCKKIVLRHNGTISATGVPNQGATFTIILPVK